MHSPAWSSSTHFLLEPKRTRQPLESIGNVAIEDVGNDFWFGHLAFSPPAFVPTFFFLAYPPAGGQKQSPRRSSAADRQRPCHSAAVQRNDPALVHSSLSP